MPYIFDAFSEGVRKQIDNENADVLAQLNKAKLAGVLQDQDLQNQSRQVGMQIAQTNLAKQTQPAVNLSNIQEVPDAGLESMGKTAEVAIPTTAKVPKQSELLSQQADELKTAALKFGSIGNIQQQTALMKESDNVREKLYLTQKEERTAEAQKQKEAAGAVMAVNSQEALDNLWGSSDPEHRKSLAPLFNIGLDGKPIYDEKGRAALDYVGNKVLDSAKQNEFRVKAINQELAATKAENERLNRAEQIRVREAEIAARREGVMAKADKPPKDYMRDENGNDVLKPDSPTAMKIASGIRAEQTKAIKPIDEIQQKITKANELLQQSTPASDVQLQMALTDVFDKTRATNMLFASNRNFGSIAGRVEGLIGRAFTGQYTDAQRSEIKQMLDGMQSQVLEPTRQKIGDHFGELAKSSGVKQDLVKTPNFYGGSEAKKPNATMPSVKNESDYAALEKGTQYTAPDGSVRIKK